MSLYNQTVLKVCTLIVRVTVNADKSFLTDLRIVNTIERNYVKLFKLVALRFDASGSDRGFKG